MNLCQALGKSLKMTLSCPGFSMDGENYFSSPSEDRHQLGDNALAAWLVLTGHLVITAVLLVQIVL